MKIINLQAENIKRIVAIEITPTGNVVEINGNNESGKTSLLDSIWWALAGTRSHQPMPVRDGEKEARITLDLGDIIVKREFKVDKNKQVTTRILVEREDGARFPSPQKMLDDLLDSLAFDPLQFANMNAKEQYKILTAFVPDIDFDGETMAQKSDYDRRRDYNRDEKSNRNAADHIQISEGDLDNPVDVAALMAELKSANENNESLNRKKRDIQISRDRIQLRKDTIETLQRQKKELEAALATAEDDLTNAKAESKELGTVSKSDFKETVMVEKLINDADQINRDIDRQTSNRARKEELTRLADDAKKLADELTAKMDARTKRIHDAIASADMPVEGLELKDGAAYLKGIPLEQASQARQLELSCAIAMRGENKLRVILIRNGNDLDKNMFKLVCDMANKYDCQAWIERIESGGEMGFVIEDGTLVDDGRDDQGKLAV